MTPTGGVLAILSPLSEDNLKLGKPCKMGDQLPKFLLQNIAALAPSTYPATIFKRASLGLSIRSKFSSNLVRFPQLLNPAGTSDVSLHLLMVSSQMLLSADVFLEHTGTLPVPFFSITDHPYLSALFAFHSIPHALHIDHFGRVETIVQGNYLQGKEITSGVKPNSGHRTKSIKNK